MSLLALVAALAIDRLYGEWPTAVHPVVWMGRLQNFLRRFAPKAPAPAFLYGCFMAATGPLVFGGGAALLLRAVAGVPALQFLLDVALLKTTFAIRELEKAGLAVSVSLRADDLMRARRDLRSLVSRDTSELPPPMLAAAAIESVGENLSDSFVAPVFYYALAGVPGAMIYRASNTLDAMIGYHGETEWLGKAAARLDDVLNLIPARLTALLLTITAPVVGLSARGATRIWRRDGGLTESPNAGRPMAAMAGALGVELEKRGHYRLGAGGRAPGAEDIPKAVRLMRGASLLGTALAAIILMVFHAPLAAR
jgi:adenosylcobinamide-phosphate synthase